MNALRTRWIGVALLIGLVVLAPAAATFVTDVWWFESVGYASVLWRRLGAQVGLAVGGALLALLVVGGTLIATLRAVPPPGPVPRVRLARPDRVEPPTIAVPPDAPARVAWGVVALVVLASAAAAGGAWEELLLFAHGDPFGRVDEVWGLDVGFYLLDLPLLAGIVVLFSRLLAVAGLLAIALLIGQGALKLTMTQREGQLVASGLVVPPEVRGPLSVIAAAFLLVTSVGAWLGRYQALHDQSGLFAGPGWVELNATLPLLLAQAVVTAICALVAFVTIRRGDNVAALLSVVVVPGVFVVLGMVTTPVLHTTLVAPSEFSREAPQIVHHIAATRAAWGLDLVTERELAGASDLQREDLDRNRATLESIRLWDHEPLLAAFAQVQEIRTYYGFVNVDNDRYVVDGRPRQIMLSPRELEIEALPAQARTWVNETLTYTHGYGVALGPVNEVTGEGLPRLWVRDLPPRVDGPAAEALTITRPAIYFGEATDHVVVVNTESLEFDFPSGDENAYARYAGADGIPLGRLGRLLFALRLGSTEVLLSGDLRPDSKVLLRRNVVDRVRAIAPFLRYDHDPYLVIHQGKLVWIVDAYTAASTYPYAQGVRGIGNYYRSAAKVTVDAYDGTVTFFRADATDPLTDAWDDAFPGLFRPLAEMPADLQAHLRYPTDLFSLQSMLFATYHMQGDQVFYNREDEWEVPSVGEVRMSPYFTILSLPSGTEEASGDAEFIQMLPFSPKGKPNLAAWMVARSDPPHYGELVVYKFPKDTMVYGPRMVVARVNQDDEISEKISLWDQQGSHVVLGTLLVVPIEASLLYVQPLYLRAESSSIPELKRVIVAYQDRIAMTPTLEEAIDVLFGSPEDAPLPTPAPAVAGEPAPAVSTDVVERMRQAASAWAAVESAAAAGDWATWGVAMEELGRLLGAMPDGLPQPPTD